MKCNNEATALLVCHSPNHFKPTTDTYLNPNTRWYPTLYESNRMKSTCFIIHPGKNPPPQNGCQLKSNFFSKSTSFTSSTFPSQPDFSQIQPAAITLNTGSRRTLVYGVLCHSCNSSDDTVPLINKLTNIVMDDGRVHPLAKTLLSLVSNLWCHGGLKLGWKITCTWQ
jgi:hypothetical protein